MCPRPTRYLLRPLLLTAVWASTAMGISAQTTIGDIRNQLRKDLDPGAFAALVAGFVSIDLLPQVSSGTFYTENRDQSLPDDRIDTFKMPFQMETRVGDLPGKLFLGGGLGYLKSTESIRLDVPVNGNIVSSRLDSISTAYNAMSTVGWTFDMGRGLGIRPTLGLAYSKVENEGRYDATGTVLWKPILDGLVLNWDLQAYTITAGIDLLYRQQFSWGRIEADINLIHTWTQIFDSTDPVQEGEIQNDFLASRIDLIYRTPALIWESPLDLRFRTGLFQVLQGDDGLGFKTLLELGLGAELDIEAKDFLVSRIGVMGSLFSGDRTLGWTVGVTFEL